MAACARCAALLVACVVVGAGSQAPPRPILAVSVSRSGGDTLCDLACKQFHGGPDQDCRLEGGAFHYLKALNGSVAGHNLTFAATARAMAADAALCNAVVVEPGRRLGAGARAVLDAIAAAPAGASLWTAYAWLLLVRDPIKRFVSYAAKTRGLDRRRGVSIDARPDIPSSQASTRPGSGPRSAAAAPRATGASSATSRRATSCPALASTPPRTRARRTSSPRRSRCCPATPPCSIWRTCPASRTSCSGRSSASEPRSPPAPRRRRRRRPTRRRGATTSRDGRLAHRCNHLLGRRVRGRLRLPGARPRGFRDVQRATLPVRRDLARL